MMTTTAKTTRFASLGDRFAELSVVLLTLVALVAGWFLKSSIENRSLAFKSGSITAQVPTGWLAVNPGTNEVLHITDRTTSGFGTTYLIEVKAVPADTQAGQIVSLVTLQRGNTLTGYRVLSQQDVLIQGRKATEIDYVYVESAANLNHAVIPAVVLGQDYIFIKSGQAVIVSYRADQSVYATDLGRFYRFLVSVKY
jgi:hypothetical protein